MIAVSCNKGGVGKTTVAANLAVYLRALREDLPVLIVGLDDQETVDRMFQMSAPTAGGLNLKHGWAQRRLDGVIQLGQYGVHYVASPPDTGRLKTRAEDPLTLRGILTATEWPGVVILDTKSDLEALTVNAYHAADRIIVPVADRASLLEAAKIFRILERARIDTDRARVLLTLVDRRSRGSAPGTALVEVLGAEIERRGWSRYRVEISRSPRVEALQSAEGRPRSILHTARGTDVHRQMHDLALEVIEDLDLDAPSLADAPGARSVAAPTDLRATEDRPDRDRSIDWKAALLRGVLRRD